MSLSEARAAGEMGEALRETEAKPESHAHGGHEFPTYFDEPSLDYDDQGSAIDEQTYAELRELAGRYPQARSALLPMLHLVQSVDGRISPRGVQACAEVLGITTAEVTGVATFYTMYKRRPAGTHHVGVCTTALCAVMGGDDVLDTCIRHLGIGTDETTADGRISLERIECNAACDFAPVMMVNWEFMDNMTPDKAVRLLDDLRDGAEVTSTRGASITSWREAERVLAGFPDGRADEGPSAGPESLLGLEIAHERGWRAPTREEAERAAAEKAERDRVEAERAEAEKSDAGAEAKAATTAGGTEGRPAAQGQKAASGQPAAPEQAAPPAQAGDATLPGEETKK